MRAKSGSVVRKALYDASNPVNRGGGHDQQQPHPPTPAERNLTPRPLSVKREGEKSKARGGVGRGVSTMSRAPTISRFPRNWQLNHSGSVSVVKTPYSFDGGLLSSRRFSSSGSR